ncbi:MAG: hypothetical protein AAF849_02215 [Bacteroidota bacterium]
MLSIRLIHFFLCLLLFTACQSQESPKEEVLSMTGFIPHDDEADDPNFTLCQAGYTYPYYYFDINRKRDKIDLANYLKEQLKYSFDADFTGYLTLRFLMNCEGKLGRFRSEAMNTQWQAVEVEAQYWKDMEQALLSYPNWVLGEYEGKTYDYNYYVSLKIETGKIKEILP